MSKSNYNPSIHNRRSQRLKGYDYSKQGLYFITICCQNMEHRFGEIIQNKDSNEAKMQFNGAGEMINLEWVKLKERFQNIELHEFQTMPNHFHGIIEILDGVVACTNSNEISVRAYPCGRPIDKVQQSANLEQKGQPQGHETTKHLSQGQGNAHGQGQPQGHAPTENTSIKNKTISDILDAFKSITTVEYIRGVDVLGWNRFENKFW